MFLDKIPVNAGDISATVVHQKITENPNPTSKMLHPYSKLIRSYGVYNESRSKKTPPVNAL